MPRGSTKLLLISSALAIVGVTACAAVLGIDDGIADLDEAGAQPDGSTSDGGPGDVAEEPPFLPCTDDASAQRADDGAGVFVVQGTQGAESCGTRSSPCSTISQGIARAKLLGSKLVYVAAARNPYRETLTLAAGVTVEGGWVAKDQEWLPSCASDANSVVVVQAPDGTNVTVRAADLGGVAGLHNLTVKSEDKAGPGETLYGVQALGTTTSLLLDDVVIETAAGGDGAKGTPGATPGAAGNDCAPDSGAPATRTGDAGAPSGAGFFGDAGFVLGTGATGGAPGVMGFDGKPGGDGGCVACVTNCGGTIGLCTSSSAGTSCGQAGSPGCGGAPGTPGGPGGSGGSSVPLFVWDANVSVLGGALRAGNGGASGPGGIASDGGAGGGGGAGAAGPACTVDCAGASCGPVSGHGAPGGQGIPGGQGSSGGNGGEGAAGWSFAYVHGGAATVNVDGGAALSHGSAGAKSGAGAPGQEGDRWPP